MAETYGSLQDKYFILCIRAYSIISKKSPTETKEQIEERHKLADLVVAQRNDIQNEIKDFTILAEQGRAKLQEPKYKTYKGEVSSGLKFDNIDEARRNLFETNQILWDLEDLRRDKTKSDAEIRKICDDVAKYNRIRNDTIDEINTLFSLSIQQRKTQ
jgi:hypothetical protein